MNDGLSTTGKEIKHGDVVQITNPDHAWFPSLLVVDEVRSWGVIAYCTMPQSNVEPHSVGLAYNRLRYEDIERVGEALIMSGSSATKEG